MKKNRTVSPSPSDLPPRAAASGGGQVVWGWKVEAALFAVVAALTAVRFAGLFQGGILPNWDAPGHYYALLKMAEFLASGHVTGYMTEWLGGLPLFQFYGPLPFALTAGTWLATGKLVSLAWLFRLSIYLSVLAAVAALWFFAATFVSRAAGRAMLALSPLFVFYPMALSTFGIGATGAVWVGLISSTVGSALVLVWVSFLERVRRHPDGRADFLLAVLAGAALITTHVLSFVFGAVLVACWLLTLGRDVRAWARAAAVGAWSVSLAAFWLLPFAATVGMSSGAVRGEGQLTRPFFLDLFPFHLPYLNVAAAIFLGLALVGLVVAYRGGHRRLLVLLAGAVAFFLLRGPLADLFLTVGIHYYRFLVIVYSLVLVVASVGLTWLWGVWAADFPRRRAYVTALAVIAVALYASAFNVVEPEPGEAVAFSRVNWQASDFELDADGRRVTEMLGRQDDVRRVHVELPMLDGLVRLGSLSYFNAKLPLENSQSTILGLYMESGPLEPYISPVTNTLQGGWVPVWGQETLRRLLPFMNQGKLIQLGRLASFGVNYVVAYSDELAETLAASGRAEEVGVAGPFRVFRLAGAAPLAYAAPARPGAYLSGYGGPTWRGFASVLFAFPETYDFPVVEEPRRLAQVTDAELARLAFVVVDGSRLTDAELARLAASGLPVVYWDASYRTTAAARDNWRLVPAPEDVAASEKRYDVWPVGWEELAGAVAALREESPAEPVGIEEFTGRRIRLAAGSAPVVVNTAYFPYWQVDSGAARVYRVTPEKMLVFPDGGGEVVLEYRADGLKKFSVALSWISLAALAFYAARPFLRFRRRVR